MERDHGVFFIGVVIGVVLFSNFMADHHPRVMAEINPAKERINIHNQLQYTVVISHLSRPVKTLKKGEPWAHRFPLGQVLTANVLNEEGELIGTAKSFRVPDRYVDDIAWDIDKYTPTPPLKP